MNINAPGQLISRKARFLFYTRNLLLALLGAYFLSACSEGGGISSDAASSPVVVLTSIEITPTDPSIALGTTQRFIATGIYSNGTKDDISALVSWRSSDNGIATPSNDSGNEGLVTCVGVGSAKVAAEVNGINGSTQLTVTPAVLSSLAITPTSPGIALGTKQQFTATGTYTDGTTQDLTTAVSWSSSTDGVATVSNAAGSQGLVSSVMVGDVKINATYSGVSTSTQLSITPAALTSLAITPTNPAIALGTTQQFTAIGTYTDTTTQDLTAAVTWSSSDTGIAEVSNVATSNGLASSLALGTVTIEAALNGITTSTQLTINSSVLTSLAITPTNPSVALGTKQQLTATGTYSDSHTQDLTTAVIWNSSDMGIVTVSNAKGSEGLATSITIGNVMIGAALSGVTTSTQLTITPAVLTSLAIMPPNPSIALGTKQQFTATGTYSDATTQDRTDSVTWDSSNTNVATISNAALSRGLASSIGVGPTTVTATDPMTGINANTAMAVTPAVLASLAITPTNPAIALGTSQQFTATGTYTDNTTQDLTTAVTWSSSDSGIAAVSNAANSHGLATSVAEGSVTIGATLNGVATSTPLTVSPAALVALAITPTNPAIALGTSQQFTATGTYTDNTTQDLTTAVTWSSSDSGIAAVSNAANSHGLATSVAEGSVAIGATLNGITTSTPLTVSPAALVALAITPTNPAIALGTKQQLTATGTYTDNTTQDLTAAVTWSSSDSGIAAVSNAAGNQGLATSVAQGNVTIGATLNGITTSTQLTVTPAALVALAITPTNPVIALGTKQQFTATGTYTDNTTQDLTTAVTWSSSNTGIAAVSNATGSHGLATSMAQGNVGIGATLNGITTSTQLTVSPAALVSLAITPTNPTIALGTTQQFTATGTYTDNTTQDLTAAVTWSSSDSGIATVSNAAGSHGLATSAAQGSVTIGATLNGVATSTQLTVSPAALVALAITPTNPAIALGTKQQFTATGTYTDNTTQDLTTAVTWSSSDSGIAAVSNAAGSEGLATSVAVGTTTIGVIEPDSTVSNSTNLMVSP